MAPFLSIRFIACDLFNLAISPNKKYELRTNLASKRQKRILTILLHQRSFEVCLIIFTVASFLTENSLNQQEIGVFIYTIAWLKFSCYNMRNIFVCIKIWQWFTRNALIKVISILRDLHALRVQRLVINAFIVYLDTFEICRLAQLGSWEKRWIRMGLHGVF